MVEAIVGVRAQKPAKEKLIAKLNQGGGLGNATIHLDKLPPPGDFREAAATVEALQNMQFEIPDVKYEAYPFPGYQRWGYCRRIDQRTTLHQPQRPTPHLALWGGGDAVHP